MVQKTILHVRDGAQYNVASLAVGLSGFVRVDIASTDDHSASSLSPMSTVKVIGSVPCVRHLISTLKVFGMSIYQARQKDCGLRDAAGASEHWGVFMLL